MLQDLVRDCVEQGRIQGIEQGIEQGRAEGVERGMEQGLAQGLEQGRGEARALLCGLAARKFDAAADELADLLADGAHPDRLEQVGDCIIECETAADLLARVRDHAAPADEGQRPPEPAATQHGRRRPARLTHTPGAPKRPPAKDPDRSVQSKAPGDPTATILAWLTLSRMQGLERGREEARALLWRLAARKFGAAADELADILADGAHPDRLEQVGEWIVDSATPADLIARVRDHAAWTDEGQRSMGAAAKDPLAQLQETHDRLDEIFQERREQGRVMGLDLGIEVGRARGVDEGIEQGRARGVEQSRGETRALLCRMAARKLDAGTSGLDAALAGVTDPDRLAQVGDCIIECETAADLLARVRRGGRPGG